MLGSFIRDDWGAGHSGVFVKQMSVLGPILTSNRATLSFPPLHLGTEFFHVLIPLVMFLETWPLGYVSDGVLGFEVLRRIFVFCFSYETSVA
jgi:hypothetical protein